MYVSCGITSALKVRTVLGLLLASVALGIHMSVNRAGFAMGGLLSFSVRDLESCVAPESVNTLYICRPSLLISLAMGSLISPPWMLQSKRSQPSDKCLVVWRWDRYC